MMSNLEKLRSSFEASTKDEWSSLSTDEWTLLRKNIMCGNRFVAEVLVDCDGVAMNDERLANSRFIILAHNMMPKILSDLERLQLLESDLNRLKDQPVELKESHDSSTEAEQEPKIRHDFTVTVSGYGTDPGEAWEDAIEAFYDAPGCYDNFCTDSTDVAD